MIDWEQEVWLPIKVSNLGEFYSVSNFGQVKRTAQGQGARQKLLKQKLNKKNGYLYVSLCVNGKSKSYSVHRLVCFTFNQGPCSDSQTDVAHNDGNRQNNKAVNLRWATRKENVYDRIEHGTFAYGAKIANSKLSYEDVKDIKNLAKCGVRRVEIAQRFDIHVSYVGALIRNEWRKHEHFVV